MKPLALAALIFLLQAPRVASPPQRTPPRNPNAAPLGAEPIDVFNAERAWAGADVLLPLLQKDITTRNAAIRALGRLEDPRLIPQLMTAGGDVTVTADAIAQSLYGFDPSSDPELLQRVWEWLWTQAGAESATTEMNASKMASVAMPMGRIAYGSENLVARTESLFATLMANTANSKPLGAYYDNAIRALESLARVNTKLVHFQPETVRRLGNAVRNTAINDDAAPVRRYAFLALLAARALPPEILSKAVADDDWQTRRGAMQVIAGNGGGLDELTRASLIRDGLKDDSAHVRYEAVRAYARHAAGTEGCQALLDALRDDDPGVVLEAADLLGDACKDSDDVTMRLMAEAQVPPVQGPWQRQAHAFVSFARRAPDRVTIVTEAFVTHPNWWVRMYAAYAMAAAKDLIHLEKLAYDVNDNVREAAVTALRTLDKEAGLRAAVAALQERSDVQLLRTAAIMAKEEPPSPGFYKPLFSALDRLTKDGRVTSRDARLEILAAIDKHAKAEQYVELLPWLKDFDARVAERASLVIAHLSGKTLKAEPPPVTHAVPHDIDALNKCVNINMASGRTIQLRMDPGTASVAVEQFLQLATVDKYYDGLTFHRIVPNFVLQAGSPGANEYSGGREYMRDEIGASNERGTVGLSTRGRDTGDAQFFINLVDNPRLDGNYTVFARISETDMTEVDRIQEGDVMKTLRLGACPASR